MIRETFPSPPTPAPALAAALARVFLACLVALALKSMDWADKTEYLPAMLTLLALPFTFSIAAGIGPGFLTFVANEVLGAAWPLSALCAVKPTVI